MGVRRLREMALAGWEGSIIRRSILLQGIYSIGFVFNFGTIYSVNRLLDEAEFGIFYFSYTIVLVLIALIPMVNLYLSGNLAEVAERHGEAAAWAQSWLHVIRIAVVGAVLSAVLILLLLASGAVIGISAYHLIVLAVLIAYTCYLTEVGRIVFQGLRRTVMVGLYGLTWMVVRFVFVTIAVYLTRSVWGALTGLLISGPVVFAPVLAVIARRRRAPSAATEARLWSATRPQVKDFITFSSAFGLFVLLAYLDVGLAYLKFTPEVLGRYSASNVIPKGIVTFALPILQVAFPAMAAKRVSSRIDGTMVIKGVVATLLVAGGACLIAYLGEPLLCGGIGIAGCTTPLMDMMLVAVVPLCMLRLAITTQFALRARRQGPVLLALIVLCALVLTTWATTPAQLATGYAVATIAVTMAYLLFALAPRLLAGRFPAR